MSVKNSQAAVAARNLNAAFKHCRNQEPQRSVRTGQPDGAADELHARHFGREISRRAHLPADRIGMRALAGAIVASGFMLGAADATSANARPIIQQSQLKARPVLAKPAEVALNEKLNDSRRLIVKFAEGSAIRAVNGEFMQDADGVRVPGHAHDIFHINNALKTKPALLRSGAVRIDRLFSRPPEVLDADRASGMSRSGQVLADLNLYHVVEFDSSVSPADAQALANSLIKLGVVETAYFEPKTRVNAVDVAPATPAFDYRQNHLDRAFDGKTRDPATGLFYNGIDARYAWNFPGGRGAGMKFIDVEFGWNTNHEDLASPTIPRDPDTSDRWHGTAILGLINAQPNG